MGRLEKNYRNYEFEEETVKRTLPLSFSFYLRAYENRSRPKWDAGRHLSSAMKLKKDAVRRVKSAGCQKRAEMTTISKFVAARAKNPDSKSDSEAAAVAAALLLLLPKTGHCQLHLGRFMESAAPVDAARRQSVATDQGVRLGRAPTK